MAVVKKKVVAPNKYTALKNVPRVKKYDGGGSVGYEVGKEVLGLEPKGYWDSTPESPNTISETKTPAKKIAGGFSSEAQKNSYIKQAKNLILKGETISSLVKNKFGTASGLKALGIVDKPLVKNPIKNKVEVSKPPIKNKVEVIKSPIKNKVEVIKSPIKNKVEVIKSPIKNKKNPETEGQRLTRIGKKQANSYKTSPESNSKQTKTGRIDTVVNTKQNGNKQTKVTAYNKKGEKLKTYYKEAGSRSSLDTTGRKYLNSKGTIYTEIDRIGNKKVTKGKNISMDPTKKGAFKRGSIIEKISYKNPSGFISTLDYSKKPVVLRKGGKKR